MHENRYIKLILFAIILLNIVFLYATDEEFLLDKIVFKGDGRSKERFLKRCCELKENRHYSRHDIEEAKTKLINTGFYAEVEYEIEKTGDNKYNLIIAYKERITKYPFPLPFVSYYPERNKLPFKDRIELGLKYTDRHFLGNGYRIAFTGAALGLWRLEGEWVSPWGYKDIIGYQAKVSYYSARNPFPEDTLDITKDKYIVSEAGLNFFPLKRFGAYSLAGIEYFKRIPAFELYNENGDLYVREKLGAYYDTRDIYENPLKGFRISSETVFYQGLYKNIPYVGEHNFSVTHIIPIWKKLRFASGGVASYISGKDIPPYKQGHWGGGSSLRGYEEGDWEYIKAVRGNFEIRFPIIPKKIFDVPYTGRWGKNIDLTIDGGFFLDAGYLYSGRQIEYTRYYEDYKWYPAGGVGGGIRFIVPWFGCARIDYGVARNRKIKDGILHLSLNLIP
ncbi:MAG: BamA/TamA family outer membrane protein [Candidatus Coatesbacteria bacterium]|nr:BamA/TamA family outer membrane protein [Candidatus Coatesbacteria bacterium]